MISVIFIEQDIHFSTWFSKLATSVEQSVQWIGEAQTGAKGIELVRQHKAKQPLFVFLDVDLPDMSGEWICRYIHRHWPTIKCIFLINPLHWSTLSRLAGSPAQGFLTKYACYLCFEAIKVVNGGKKMIRAVLADSALGKAEKSSQLPLRLFFLSLCCHADEQGRCQAIDLEEIGKCLWGNRRDGHTALQHLLKAGKVQLSPLAGESS